jgi:Concanavalin A-like lectin/glucanases superfamily
LYSDLQKRNPGNGVMSDKDLALFKSKLGEYLQIVLKGKTFRNMFKSNVRKNKDGLRSWFWRIARLKIKAKQIKDDPIIKQLLTDPQAVSIPKFRKPKIRLLANKKGWRIPLELSSGARYRERYSYECPLRKNIRILRTLATDYSLMRINFSLPENSGAATLVLEGQDDDKVGTTAIRIEVNGKNIFIGKNSFPEHNWGLAKYKLPAGLLKKGKNEIVIEDTEEGANFQAQWLMISDLRIETNKQVKGPAPETLLLLHFDKSLDADIGSPTKANIRGKVNISPKGKWGAALDAGYFKKFNGALWYTGSGNVNASRGTIEMWVKAKLEAESYWAINYFLRVVSKVTPTNGIILSRYPKKEKTLKFFCYDGRTIEADISSWKPDKWHHIAITWDKNTATKQLFIDGVFIKKSKFKAIPSPDRIYVGCLKPKAVKNFKYSAGALIDELRITDSVLWKGKKRGEKVFSPPQKPYKK